MLIRFLYKPVYLSSALGSAALGSAALGSAALGSAALGWSHPLVLISRTFPMILFGM